MIGKWLANFLTSANLLCGLLSILMAMDGHPQLAAWLILLAAVLDAFDGKVARFFGGGTRFGLEFDSLADMVSFGIAPAALAYVEAFSDLDLPGIAVTFIPVLCAAIRLARFNVHADGKAHDFVGLGSPLHASLVASFMLMNYSLWGDIADSNVLAGLMLLTSILMVSRLPLSGLPRFTLREPGQNLIKLIFLVAALAFVAVNPPRYAFVALTAVVVAGFISAGVRSLLARGEPEDELEDSESEPVTVYRGRR